MKRYLIVLAALAALLIPAAANASHTGGGPGDGPKFTGNPYCIGGHTAVSSNILQDVFLASAAKFKFAVSTDEAFGPLAPYGFADRDADDALVTKGACPLPAGQGASSAFFCRGYDNTEEPMLYPAVISGIRPNTADAVAAGWHNPTAVPLGKDKTAAVAGATSKTPTIIGGVSGNQYYELLCGEKPTSGAGAVDKNGDLTKDAWTMAQIDWYPVK